MKKLVLCLVLVLCCVFVSAKELDVFVGRLFVPKSANVATETGAVRVIADTQGFNFGYYSVSEKNNLSFITSLGICSPSALLVSASNNNNVVREKLAIRDVYNSFLIVNNMLGVAFSPVKTQKFKLLLCPTFTIRYEVYSDYEYNQGFDIYLGIGGIAGANFYLSSNFYLALKLPFGIDFVCLGTPLNDISLFGNPSLGVGMRF